MSNTSSFSLSERSVGLSHCALLQQHGAERLTRGLDHAALNAEAKICDHWNFFRERWILRSPSAAPPDRQ